ncbi:unnamed protein product [Paramecium octaurelia]|uniref:Uncharacterized protein n=1 Tax=Paramecium octaurelia TaxID=43137 RepID=A0A8S1Y916_PAROT|nr:unnamed protein product [Paramecium octaurelia]
MILQLNKKIGKKHQYTLNNNNKMISHYSIQVQYYWN